MVLSALRRKCLESTVAALEESSDEVPELFDLYNE